MSGFVKPLLSQAGLLRLGSCNLKKKDGTILIILRDDGRVIELLSYFVRSGKTTPLMFPRPARTERVSTELIEQHVGLGVMLVYV